MSRQPWLLTFDAHSSVHSHVASAHVPGLVRREKRDDARHFFDGPDATARLRPVERLACAMGIRLDGHELVGHRRVDRARRNRVHPDPFRSVVDRHSLRQRNQRSLGSRIRSETGKAIRAVIEAIRTIPPPALRMSGHFTADQIRSLDVHGEHAIPVGFRGASIVPSA
jgi:hypothetical protein